VVCDRGLTLGDLIGQLHLFFSRLGLKKLRFKPAFNPYTEPSMEIFSYSEQLGKWVEVRSQSSPIYWPCNYAHPLSTQRVSAAPACMPCTR
jgi:hypothetical protein